MKHISFFSLIIILISSCTPTQKFSEKQEIFYIVDFTKYSSEGFYISPEKPLGEYTPIGIIDYRFLPEARKVMVPTQVATLNLDGSTTIQKKEIWIRDRWEFENCMDTLVNICREMGADALYNFEISPNEKTVPDGVNTYTIEGVRITGFALNRATRY